MFTLPKSLTAITFGLILLTGCTPSVNPVTLAQRIVEDRSASDIAADTEITARVVAAMADNKVISVSTLVYEQQLVAFGVVTDRTKFRNLERDFKNISEIKRLRWHVTYMSEAEKTRRDAELLGIAETVAAKAKIEAEWLKTDGIESPNFRVGIDPLGTAFVLGRAASKDERRKALDIVQRTEDVKKLRNYAFVRP